MCSLWCRTRCIATVCGINEHSLHHGLIIHSHKLFWLITPLQGSMSTVQICKSIVWQILIDHHRSVTSLWIVLSTNQILGRWLSSLVGIILDRNLAEQRLIMMVVSTATIGMMRRHSLRLRCVVMGSSDAWEHIVGTALSILERLHSLDVSSVLVDLGYILSGLCW